MFFCDRIGKILNKPHQKLDKEFTVSVYDKASKAPVDEWNAVLKTQDLFLSLDYLKILENMDGKTFHARYVIVYRSKNPVGIIYFQTIDFEAKTFGDLL